VTRPSTAGTDDTPTGGGSARARRVQVNSGVLIAGIVAIVVFAAVGAFVWARDSSNSTRSSTPTKGVTVPGVNAEIVSLARLRALALAGGRAIYWAGPQPGAKLEYTQKTNGITYVRYLTGSAKAGAPGANYIVIATYLQPNAYTRVKRTAERQHLFVAQLRNSAIAVTRPDRPQNINVVYPGRPYQVEVYTPKPAETRRLVFGDAIQAVH
jgi:hypothetical protein